MSPNQEKLEVTKETQEKRQPSQVHGDVGSTLCRSSRCSLRVQEMYLFGFTMALKIFSLTKGLPTASTNTENMATQRSDRPQTQKKKKRPAWDLQTHWLSRYWHTGGRRNVLPALKSTRALASNLYVPQPLVHADKGGSWRTSTAPVKGDQEMQVSSQGLLRQLLRIHK